MIFQRHAINQPPFDPDTGMPTPISTPEAVEMPTGAAVERVAFWPATGQSFLWVIEDSTASLEIRYFQHFPIGSDVPDTGLIGIYDDISQFSWAVYEVPAPA